MTRDPDLLGQTVLIIDGSSGIGLETARGARAEGAHVILTGPDTDGIHTAGLELEASIAALDPVDFDRLERFFAELPIPIDHLLLSAGGPRNASLAELDLEQARRQADHALLLPLRIAQLSTRAIRPGGSVVLIADTRGRRISAGPLISAMNAALPALTRSLALELAPVRVNLVATGKFVDMPRSAAMLRDQQEERHPQPRATLPIGHEVDSRDIAAAVLHLMANSAITGATLEVDGGPQLASV
jgi:NAD(P)-dependent dehydrogenase (short-subunit alcohol dehydrogenase family)